MNPDLPPVTDAKTLVDQITDPPKELLKGILHQGSKGVLGGASKTNKTWILVDLGLSIAYGKPFLGVPTTQGPVLFLNLEVQATFFARRLKAVAEAKGITLTPGVFDTWNLRGFCESYDKLMPKLLPRIIERKYALVILDPIYKILGDADENKTTDIAKMLNQLENVANQSNSAVFFAAHFPKGNMAERESIDRISGSGVFARDPDTIITVTRHKEDSCYTMDMTLRNFPPFSPIVVRWKHPLMAQAAELDPKDIKEPRAKGRPRSAPEGDDLASLLPSSGFSYSEWAQAASERLGMKIGTFKSRLKALDQDGVVEKVNGVWLPVSLGQILEKSQAEKAEKNGASASAAAA